MQQHAKIWLEEIVGISLDIQNLGIQNVRNENALIFVPRIDNQNTNRNGNVVAARAEGNVNMNNGNQIRCYNYKGLGHLEEAGIQLQDEEFDLMATAVDLDDIEKVNTNCILMANLQQALTSGTQTDKAPVYDSDGSAEEIRNAKLWNDWDKTVKIAKDDNILYDQAYNDISNKRSMVANLSLGDALSGESKDTYVYRIPLILSLAEH
ncbi:hypothetical protein Tco_1192472 [Tanacetum coccineum]